MNSSFLPIGVALLLAVLHDLLVPYILQHFDKYNLFLKKKNFNWTYFC